MTKPFHRIKELTGLYVRLHVNRGKVVTTIDGVCQGIEGEAVVIIDPGSGERTEVPLEQVGAITQLAQERPPSDDDDLQS